MPYFDADGKYQADPALLQRLPDWFPPDRKSQVPEDTFEIGLALAGAVSGGAYMAGFLDFMVQALDEWHARRDEAQVPKHRVRLKTVAGASAGGINAALLAFAARHRFRHGDQADPGLARELESNPFYQTWVEQIDLRTLLKTDDLRGAEDIHSLLNAQRLDEISRLIRTFFANTPAPPDLAQIRPWCADHFSVHFTLANLCGVPFSLGFRGDERGHLMRLHKDHCSFAVPVTRALEVLDYPPDHLRLTRNYQDQGWSQLLTAALATSAFPAALSARVVKRSRHDYDWRFVGCTEQGRYHYAPPLWHLDQRPDQRWDPDHYSCLAVDGGAMDNEPFDLVHRILAGLYGRNPRGALDANRAVIMVDPFPELPALGPDAGRPILETLMALVTAWMNNARFKPGDLLLAAEEDIYSRYLVVPRRPPNMGKLRFAAAGLGGFSGFLDVAYRHYDFFLGRLNAYKFFRDWFVLPESHPLFQGRVAPASKATFASHLFPDHLQIIPLMGPPALVQENAQYLPPWPKGQIDQHKLAEIEDLVTRRVSALLPLLAGEVGEKLGGGMVGGSVKGLINLFRPLERKRLVGMVMEAIRQAVASVEEG